MRLDLDIAYPERLSVILNRNLPLLSQLLVGTLLAHKIQFILNLLPVENHGKLVVLERHHHPVPLARLLGGIDKRPRGLNHTTQVVRPELLLSETVEDLDLKPVGGGI